jgi:nitroreductase
MLMTDSPTPTLAPLADPDDGLPTDPHARAALSLVLERRSAARLGEPAPSGAALRRIFEAALRVPDHKRLRPYQFIVATGAGLDQLGALFQQAAVAAGQPDAVVQRAATLPHRAPMVVVVVAHHRTSDAVPAFEQQLAAGCTVMAMELAAQALGFGGIWRSGWPMYDRALHRDLGIDDRDQIVGFLYLGTPEATVPPLPPEDPAPFVRWL